NHRPVFVNFAAQAMNEDVHDVGLRIEAVIENVLEDHGLGDGAIGVAHEVFEERKLARLQVNLLAGALHLAAEQIHGQVANDKAGWLGGLRGAADEGLDAREQLGESEGLGQVIVAPSLEAPHAIIHGSLGAEDEDGNAAAFGAELLDDTQTVELG